MSYTEQIESNYFNKWYYNYANDHIDGINKEGLSKLLDDYYKFKEPQELESGTWTALSEDVPSMTNQNYCKYVRPVNAGNEDLNQQDCNDFGLGGTQSVNSLTGNVSICITENTDLCDGEEEHIINEIPYKFTPHKKKDIVKDNSTSASCSGVIKCKDFEPTQESDCLKGCSFDTVSSPQDVCKYTGGSNVCKEQTDPNLCDTIEGCKRTSPGQSGSMYACQMDDATNKDSQTICSEYTRGEATEPNCGGVIGCTPEGTMSCGSNIISCDKTDAWSANKTIENCSQDTCIFAQANPDIPYSKLSNDICKIQKTNYSYEDLSVDYCNNEVENGHNVTLDDGSHACLYKSTLDFSDNGSTYSDWNENILEKNCSRDDNKLWVSAEDIGPKFRLCNASNASLSISDNEECRNLQLGTCIAIGDDGILLKDDHYQKDYCESLKKPPDKYYDPLP